LHRLVSVHLAGEDKDEISLDTLPGKFTVTRTDEVLTPYRFWSLYGELTRRDLLEHALRLVARNGGAPGVDGERPRICALALVQCFRVFCRTMLTVANNRAGAAIACDCPCFA
jgi:hypothetical protein